jgi:hypothetical protein
MSDLLNKASLVVIPSGYKEDTVYSVVPSDGSGDLSFTRASNGTRINSAGLVEVCPWNLYEDSENFSVNALASASITSNTTTAPNGTTTADSLVEDGTNNLHAVYDFGAITYVAGIYTLSCYVKKGSRDWVRIQLYDGTNTPSAYANVNTGVLGVVSSGATASIENVGDGWYRVIFSATMVSAVGGWAIYGATSDGGTTYQGVNGSTALYLWGIQCNIGSTAKPYFPTTDRLNVPRLTYQNGGGGCPSLLLEKQSTNISNQSEDFNNWPTQVNVTTTANYDTSPDGTQNADRVQFTGAGYMYGANGYSQTNGTVYTVSCWAKRNGSGSQSVGFFVNGSGSVNSAWSLSSEYQRFTYTYTATNSSLVGIAGASGADVSVWGWQFEASSYPTSYIPTTSASATRVADACLKTGISSLIGQTEGVLFVDFDYEAKPDLSGNVPMVIYDGSNEAYIFITTSGGLRLELYNGGSLQCLITTSIGSEGRKKIAFAYKQNDFVGYMNGTQIGTDTTGTVGSMTNLYVGSYYSANYSVNGGINESILFPTRLTNAELASLTTI